MVWILPPRSSSFRGRACLADGGLGRQRPSGRVVVVFCGLRERPQEAHCRWWPNPCASKTNTVVPKSPWGSTPSLDRSRPRLTTTDTGRVQSQTGEKNTLRPPNRWWPNSARPKPQKIELHLARARISRISVSVWTVNQEERQDVVPVGQSRDFGMRSWTNKICNRGIMRTQKVMGSHVLSKSNILPSIALAFSAIINTTTWHMTLLI
jgi:hypothetical protein